MSLTRCRYFLDGLNVDFEYPLAAGPEADWLTHIVATLTKAAKGAIADDFQISVVRTRETARIPKAVAVTTAVVPIFNA